MKPTVRPNLKSGLSKVLRRLPSMISPNSNEPVTLTAIVPYGNALPANVYTHPDTR